MRQPVEHWVLQRIGGLGDVCMLLAACKALKAENPACSIWVVTAPAFADLAAACPHVDDVFTGLERLEEAMLEARFHHPAFKCHALNAVQHGLAPLHQVESYLAFIDRKGLPPTHKDLELAGVPDLPEAIAALPAPAPGKRRIVFHPAQGDPNRTWPRASWETLGQRVLREGHQLILVGDRQSDPAKGVLPLDLPGAISLTDRLAKLDLVALFRHSDLFLSTDSGPVQLAGASDVAICGIYTTVLGRARLPFRHGQPLWGATAIEPPCPQKGCYQGLLKPENLSPAQTKILTEGGPAVNGLFATWCLEKDSHHCLRDITPGLVWEAMAPWIQMPPPQREVLCRAAAALGAEGQVTQALALLDSIPPVESDLQTHLTRARLLLEAGDPEAASPVLNAVLGVWPVHGEALNLLGLVCIRNGLADTARTFVDLASQHGGPADAVARNQAYLEALGALEANDPEAADGALERAGAIPAPEDSVSDLELAVLGLSALLLQERLEDAGALLSRLGPLVRNHADLSYLAGEVQLRQDRPGEALLAFKACLELNPRHELAAARLLEIVST